MSSKEHAYGALLGLFVGDGFGSQSDGFLKKVIESAQTGPLEEIYSLEDLQDGCGISGEVSDFAVLFSLSLFTNQGLDADHFNALLNRYQQDCGNEVSLEGYRVALPLSVVLAIAGIELTQKQLKEIAVKTASNFCEEAIEREATALLTHCLYLLVTQEVAEGKKLIHTLLTQRGRKGIDERLRSILEQAKEPKITLAGNHSLRETLVLVFHTIYHASSVERGMSKIAKEGGDARLACGLYGAIQGAQYGPTLFKERWIGELVPSSAIEQAIKRQTLFRRETIKMEKLAFTLGERLLTSELLGR